MSEIIHSVSLDKDKCLGCTNCIKRCPTEAIRVRNHKAYIINDRCIDCGECIRICPHHAKRACIDKFEFPPEYKWKIALPPPSLYGQFDNLDDIDILLTALLDCGFDDIYEVARSAEIVSEYTRLCLADAGLKKPVISSACPVITRLISIRFPSLCENVLPVLPPIEIAALAAKKRAAQQHPELSPSEIGVFFITPCPAKVSYIKNPIGVSKSAVDGAFSMSELYFTLLSKMKKVEKSKPLSRAGVIGVSWAGSGGEASALFAEKYLAADGIENCINVLDEIENGKIHDIEFIELNACIGGCVGGTLAVENPFIAKARLQSLRRYLPIVQNRIEPEKIKDEPLKWQSELEYSSVMKLDDNMSVAMKKISEMERICKIFPGLDCGACGAPTCRALAEDIVRGKEAGIDDCIFVMRERLTDIYRTMSEIVKTEE